MHLARPLPPHWSHLSFTSLQRHVRAASWWGWLFQQAASEAPKLEVQEAPPAPAASTLPPSGTVPPWERADAPELGEGIKQRIGIETRC